MALFDRLGDRFRWENANTSIGWQNLFRGRFAEARERFRESLESARRDGTAKMRIRKAFEDGGGTTFADYVWKPLDLIEMKARGADLSKHYRQAFDYWVRLVSDRPQYVVLCNFR